MKSSVAIGTLLSIAAGVTGAGAIQLKGSDSLELLTKILTGEANPSTAGLSAPGYTGSPVGAGFIDFTSTAVDCGGGVQGNTVPSPVTTNSGAVQYVGIGTGNGESGLAGGTQAVAPMVRALAGSATGSSSGGPSGICVASAALQAQAESIPFGLDSVVVIGNAGNFNAGTNQCNGTAQDCSAGTEPTAGIAYTTGKVISALGYVCPPGGVDVGCVDGSYRITDFKDALRLIYAGFDHDASNDRAKRDCDSPTRAALASNWGNVFEGSCTTGTCTRIQHAFRRNDESTTTDVFVSLLGLPSVSRSASAANPSRSAFCNAVDSNDVLTGALPAAPIALGDPANATPPNTPAVIYYSDFQDRDPIRRTCAGSFTAAFEQVCSARGDLGLVLPIWDAPTPAATTTSVAFPTVLCATGKFINAAAPQSGLTFGACPNGKPAVGGTCVTPATAAGDPNCINQPGNFFVAQGRVDGRVYNLHLHSSDKKYINSTRAVGSVNGPASVNTVGAYYRIHTTRDVAGGAVNICQQGSATQQIGCLVGSASPCSIGYAGREASQQTGAFAFKVGAIDPIDQCVRNLIVDPANKYPLSRRLYINTLSDFGSGNLAATLPTGNDPQGKLAKCMATRSIVDQAVIRTGFTTLDTTGDLQPTSLCEDFNEQTVCGQASNSNACANTTTVP